ncbi:MAG: glycoside hydrolase family 3 N-terminal domain-containing protein [Rikenellaceae bacterium]
MRKILFSLFASLVAVGCAPSLDEKLGQLLVVGFVGTTPDSVVTSAIEECGVGGVIFFDMNLSDNLGVRNVESPSQLSALCSSLQDIAHRSGLPELFLCIDQEGGLVNRLKPIYGFPATRSAWELGRVGFTDSTFAASVATACTLRELGVNVNFAPCVDLNINRENPIIAGKERAFSSVADSVYLHSKAWVEGHDSLGVITSLKHFPGHGSSVKDSHLGLVDITETWSDDELTPYRRMIEGGYNDIVMIGHLFNSNLDDEYPASLSKKTIDILRKDMGYNGVIATDDMNMGAIVEHYSLEHALELALNAGVDMIIMGNNAAEFEADFSHRTLSILRSLVKSGKVSEARIDEAYNRIRQLKSKL